MHVGVAARGLVGMVGTWYEFVSQTELRGLQQRGTGIGLAGLCALARGAWVAHVEGRVRWVGTVEWRRD